MYSTKTSREFARKEAYEKRINLILKIISIAAIIALTLACHAFTVWRNGREGIGGEAMIPVLAILLYLSYRETVKSRIRHRKYQAKLRMELERLKRENEMAERKINCKVVFEEGFQGRWFESLMKVYEKRKKNQNAVEILSDNLPEPTKHAAEN